MLYRIARKIKTDYLDGLSFADRTGGLVRALRHGSGDTQKVFPVENNQDKVLGDAQYMRRLVPNSDKKSVMYFEADGSPTAVEWHNNWTAYEGSMKLIVWLDYQQVDPDMYSPEYLIAEIKQAIPFSLGNFECLTAVTCAFNGQDNNDGSHFSDYTYNETESQFFKYPYEYFVINLDIGYRVVTNCYQEGLSSVPVDPVLIQMTGNGAKSLSFYGVSGKEYQTYGYASDLTVLSARTLHEYSGETQTYAITPSVGLDSYFQIDYGREYLRGITASNQGITNITIPDDDMIRLEYVDLSDNAIAVESVLVALIDHCYDTGLSSGEMDISGGTNAAITDVTALAQITEMVTNRGWTITKN